jgi:hypothetical protein
MIETRKAMTYLMLALLLTEMKSGMKYSLIRMEISWPEGGNKVEFTLESYLQDVPKENLDMNNVSNKVLNKEDLHDTGFVKKFTNKKTFDIGDAKGYLNIRAFTTEDKDKNKFTTDILNFNDASPGFQIFLETKTLTNLNQAWVWKSAIDMNCNPESSVCVFYRHSEGNDFVPYFIMNNYNNLTARSKETIKEAIKVYSATETRLSDTENTEFSLIFAQLDPQQKDKTSELLLLREDEGNISLKILQNSYKNWEEVKIPNNSFEICFDFSADEHFFEKYDLEFPSEYEEKIVEGKPLKCQKNQITKTITYIKLKHKIRTQFLLFSDYYTGNFQRYPDFEYSDRFIAIFKEERVIIQLTKDLIKKFNFKLAYTKLPDLKLQSKKLKLLENDLEKFNKENKSFLNQMHVEGELKILYDLKYQLVEFFEHEIYKKYQEFKDKINKNRNLSQKDEDFLKDSGLEIERLDTIDFITHFLEIFTNVNTLRSMSRIYNNIQKLEPTNNEVLPGILESRINFFEELKSEYFSENKESTLLDTINVIKDIQFEGSRLKNFKETKSILLFYFSLDYDSSSMQKKLKEKMHDSLIFIDFYIRTKSQIIGKISTENSKSFAPFFNNLRDFVLQFYDATGNFISKNKDEDTYNLILTRKVLTDVPVHYSWLLLDPYHLNIGDEIYIKFQRLSLLFSKISNENYKDSKEFWNSLYEGYFYAKIICDLNPLENLFLSISDENMNRKNEWLLEKGTDSFCIFVTPTFNQPFKSFKEGVSLENNRIHNFAISSEQIGEDTYEEIELVQVDCEKYKTTNNVLKVNFPKPPMEAIILI